MGNCWSKYKFINQTPNCNTRCAGYHTTGLPGNPDADNLYQGKKYLYQGKKFFYQGKK